MKFVKPLKLFDEFFNKHTVSCLLGVGVGEKYVSIATTNKSSRFARDNLNHLPRRKGIGYIAYNLRNQMQMSIQRNDSGPIVGYAYNVEKPDIDNPGAIVVGYSCSRNKEKHDAIQAKIFIDNLRKTGDFEGVKYTYWDSMLTSKHMEHAQHNILGVNGFMKDLPEKTIEEWKEACFPYILGSVMLQGFLDFGMMCTGDAYTIDESKWKSGMKWPRRFYYKSDRFLF